jgi:hypothetical protein
MSNVATVFGVMGKSLGLLPDAVAARASFSFNVLKNQNQFKIGAARPQFQTVSRHQAIARLTFRSSGCSDSRRNRPGYRSDHRRSASRVLLHFLYPSASQSFVRRGKCCCSSQPAWLRSHRPQAASWGQQAPAALCRDCSAAWLPQAHTDAALCTGCTGAFRRDRLVRVAACMDYTAVWRPWEHTHTDLCRDCTDLCRDCSAVAAVPPPLCLGDTGKAQVRTRAWHETQFIRPSPSRPTW